MRAALVACALALLVAAPQAGAARAPDPYPADLAPLAARWIQEAEAFGASSANATWYSEAESYLLKAKNASAEGRLRVASFHVETYTELVRAHRLLDEAAAYRSDAEKKSYILGQTHEWRAEAEQAWTGYRARLHSYDGQLRSLHAIEKALYSADVAFATYAEGKRYDDIAREFPRSPGVERGFVLALARASSTVSLDVGFAHDILDVAIASEGLPPRVNDEAWANATAKAVEEVPEGALPGYVSGMEEIARPIRANNESLMSIAISLAEQRTMRAMNMETIFGDAQSRGKNIVADAARGMGKQLNNTTVQKVQAYGLEGVFTADAIDRALFAQGFIERGEATIGTVLTAWSSLDHAGYAASLLAGVSPVKPAEAKKESPGLAPAAALGAVALLAVALRRRD